MFKLLKSLSIRKNMKGPLKREEVTGGGVCKMVGGKSC